MSFILCSAIHHHHHHHQSQQPGTSDHNHNDEDLHPHNAIINNGSISLLSSPSPSSSLSSSLKNDVSNSSPVMTMKRDSRDSTTIDSITLSKSFENERMISTVIKSIVDYASKGFKCK